MIDLSAIATTGGWNTVIVSLWLVATVGCGGIGRSARPEVVDPASCGDASLPPGAELDPRLAPMAAAADSASLLAAGEVLLATAEREAAAVFHRTALAADAGVDERMARAREHRRFLEDWTMSDPPTGRRSVHGITTPSISFRRMATEPPAPTRWSRKRGTSASFIAMPCGAAVT